MELRQLEYLVAVADEANFTRAAERLHVSQPGVSAQIRQLERELGHQLLDRSGRTVRPTEVGAAVLPHARAALTSVAQIGHVIDDFTGLVRGRVSIGRVASLGFLGLPSILADFSNEHPAVEMSLREAPSDVALAELAAGTLDIAIIGAYGALPAGIDTQVIVTERIVAAVPPPHPLAARKAARLADLAPYPLMSLPLGTGVRTSLEAACSATGLRLPIAFEASEPGALAELAVRGLGVALVPRDIVRLYPEALVAVDITDRVEARIDLAWRAGTGGSPAARALIAHLRGALKGFHLGPAPPGRLSDEPEPEAGAKASR